MQQGRHGPPPRLPKGEYSGRNAPTPHYLWRFPCPMQIWRQHHVVLSPAHSPPPPAHRYRGTCTPCLPWGVHSRGSPSPPACLKRPKLPLCQSCCGDRASQPEGRKALGSSGLLLHSVPLELHSVPCTCCHQAGRGRSAASAWEAHSVAHGSRASGSMVQSPSCSSNLPLPHTDPGGMCPPMPAPGCMQWQEVPHNPGTATWALTVTPPIPGAHSPPACLCPPTSFTMEALIGPSPLLLPNTLTY